MMACESADCTHRFCTYCLAVHLGIHTDPSSSEAGAWRCPTCSSGCCCSQTECTKVHRHCKAFRYRCRRAAAANLRMSAAHALMSLGVGAPSGKAKKSSWTKSQPGASPSSAAHTNAQEMTVAQSLERPTKRRESPLPAGPSEGVLESDKIVRMGGACEDEDNTSSKTAQMEIDAGESAVGVLASFSMGLRSPSPAADISYEKGAQARNVAGLLGEEDETCGSGSCIERGPASTGRLEQLALFALQSLAAMEPIVAPSPPAESETHGHRASSEESSSSCTLDTPRTVVDVARASGSRDGYTRSKMSIDVLMTSVADVEGGAKMSLNMDLHAIN
jgi:hypothetical protein